MIAISAGHWKIGTGAKDLIDEVIEARRVAYEVTKQLELMGEKSSLIVDDDSKNQRENLAYLVRKHKSTNARLHVSIHFNSVKGGTRTKGIGTETLYNSLRVKELATKMSQTISQNGQLINRGAKQRKDLYFLNQLSQASILVEICFVNSKEDVRNYMRNFIPICKGIAQIVYEYEKKL